MDTLLSISIQTFWAFVGAVFGLLLPPLIVWWKYKRTPELLGSWESAYQGIDEIAGTWVTKRITLGVSWGKFKFANDGSSQGYNYSATGTVTQKVFMVGDWESVRPGANAHGAFVLTISAQGDCMYGYWVGPDKSGARRYGRWLLARSSSGMQKAKRLMDSMCLPSDIPSNAHAQLNDRDVDRIIKAFEVILRSAPRLDS